MSELTVADATNRIYQSLQADNEEIDPHIAALKEALKGEGLKEAVLDPTKLVQNNRSGRKLLQAYFRQRGVKVKFVSPCRQAAFRSADGFLPSSNPTNLSHHLSVSVS